jgi:hypothetical protein
VENVTDQAGQVILQELRNDDNGAYWQDWHCEPPSEDVLFAVTSQEWAGYRQGHPVRHIYRIRLAGE